MKPCAFVAVLLVLLCLTSPRTATADAPHGPLVVLLLPGTSLADWQRAKAPTLHRILATGAVAVMNTRTARLPNDRRRETPESAVLTLGAGSRAAGGIEITEFQPALAPVPGLAVDYGDLYTRRTGLPTPPNSLVNPLWPQVTQENSTQGYDLLPGSLGDGLRQHGIVMTIGGGRFAAALACGSNGTVMAFAVGSRVPYPLPPCLVWDAGSDVTAADAIIAQAASQVDAQHGRLIVISPFVGDAAYAQGERLAPVVVWGPSVPAGLLYSPSTHQAGLVTNTDFAPSVVGFFGETVQDAWLPSAAFGRAWEFRPESRAVVHVSRLEDIAYRQSAGMRVLPVVAICLGVIVLAGFLRARIQGIPGAVVWLPSVAIFSLLVSPTPSIACLWFVATGAGFWILAGHWDAGRLTGLAAVITVLTVLGDALSGSHLMRTGLVGYSAVEGARYYGIGNEAMGVLVGSALVAAAFLWPDGRSGQVGVAAGLLLIALLLGLPAVGAKAGGLLVAVGGFAVFLWTAWGWRWRGRGVLGILVCMGLGLALASLGDRAHHSSTQSHMGQAVQRIRSGGAKEAVDIILRKLNVERRLLYHSAWAVPLWLSVIGLLGTRLTGRGTENDRRLRALRYGGVASIALCLAANDAGVVAAALCGVLVSGGLQAGAKKARADRQRAVRRGP
jgi:hypothetical protein